MSKALVIVESPAKARTIGRLLGDDVRVMASMGHVRDLPTSSLGVNVAQSFQPQYVVSQSNRKTVQQLQKAAAKVEDIYLATDHDREGEAIAWHLRELLKKDDKQNFHRVTFHEITPRAIQEAFENPGTISEDLVSSQQARRVVDRLVGYQVSPLLWKEIQKGTSAGRVQSVALRLVCEREREIQAFEPVEYWNLDALFDTRDPKARLETRLALLDGVKPEIGNGALATTLVGELENATYEVSKVQSTPRRQAAPPPFITSSLQQAGGASLRFGTRLTMRVAQELYEGVELGEGGPVGLITYMRTDSVTVAKDAQTQAREFIAQQYGAEYVPSKPNQYRSRKSAQEAHEAIRPTDVSRTPKEMAASLTARQLKLYGLIWNRFVASQMTPAKQLDHVIEVGAHGDHLTHTYIFRATARETTFAGYQKVYNVMEADEEANESEGKKLPPLKNGLPCDLAELSKDQCFTSPPRRYSEATLVRALEQNGVGRPSTYATIVSTVQTREYANREKGRLIPTDLGFSVNDYLVGNMPDLFDIKFTAEMETRLDKIEEGGEKWQDMVNEFYTRFSDWLGHGPMSTVPCLERTKEYLQIFPADLEWNEPVKRGKRTYDDKRFVASIEKQVTEQDKHISERQWNALLLLTARHADRIPDLLEKVAPFGVKDVVAEYIANLAEAAANPTPKEPDLDDLELLKSLDKVSFSEPMKRGRRTYNDKRFHESLKQYASENGKLSPAQHGALLKMVARYSDQIPSFAELKEKHQIPDPVSSRGKLVENDETVGKVVALLDKITEWDAPTGRGRRTFDDQKFAQSLREQFGRSGALSQKQVNALKKLLAKYGSQIPQYDELATELGLGALAQAPVQLDMPCPNCGEPILKRASRGKSFYGCSTFPKCRFTSNQLPGSEAESE